MKSLYIISSILFLSALHASNRSIYPGRPDLRYKNNINDPRNNINYIGKRYDETGNALLDRPITRTSRCYMRGIENGQIQNGGRSIYGEPVIRKGGY